jgi:hypothetical protein
MWDFMPGVYPSYLEQRLMGAKFSAIIRGLNGYQARIIHDFSSGGMGVWFNRFAIRDVLAAEILGLLKAPDLEILEQNPGFLQLAGA